MDIDPKSNIVLIKTTTSAPEEKKTADSVSLTTDMENDDYSLDDITVTPKEKSREEIIAAAEEAAFAE